MISSLGKQGGRRYPQLGSTPGVQALSLRSTGQAAAPAVTVLFRRTLSPVGGKVGKRQVQIGWGGL